MSDGTPDDFRLRLQQLRGTRRRERELPGFGAWPAKAAEAAAQLAAQERMVRGQERREALRRERDALKAELLARLGGYTAPEPAEPDSEPAAAQQAGRLDAAALSGKGAADCRDQPTVPEREGIGSEAWQVFQAAAPRRPEPRDEAALRQPEARGDAAAASARRERGPGRAGAAMAWAAMAWAAAELAAPAPLADPEVCEPEPDLQQALSEARELILPGVICKFLILKPGASSHGAASWELCYRKYDSLRQPLAWNRELCFEHTPQSLVYNNFSTQEMLVDLVVGAARRVCQTLPEGGSYEYVEVLTAREGYCILIYPVPALSGPRLVTLQFEEPVLDSLHLPGLGRHGGQKVLGLLAGELAAGRPLFHGHAALAPILEQPLRHYEPRFDIEKRLRHAQPLVSGSDSYQLFYDYGASSWLRARLDLLRSDKLQARLARLSADPALRPFLAAFGPHLVSSWAAGPGRRWYFSGVFYQAQPEREYRYQVVALLEWQLPESGSLLLPYLFEYCLDHESRPHCGHWTASLSPCFWPGLGPGLRRRLAAADLDPRALFEPASYLQDIISHQPLSLAQAEIERFFPSHERLADGSLSELEYHFKRACREPFADPDWRDFDAASRQVGEVFGLLRYLPVLGASTAEFEAQAQLLIQSHRLSKPVRRLLAHRLREYLGHSAQQVKHGDDEHYIFEFWRAFFRALFQSIPVPDSMLKPQPRGKAFRLSGDGQPVLIELYVSTSRRGEHLCWVIERDSAQSAPALRDIQIGAENLGLDLELPAFEFMRIYRALPEPVKTLIRPHWDQFAPLAGLG